MRLFTGRQSPRKQTSLETYLSWKVLVNTLAKETNIFNLTDTHFEVLDIASFRKDHKIFCLARELEEICLNFQVALGERPRIKLHATVRTPVTLHSFTEQCSLFHVIVSYFTYLLPVLCIYLIGTDKYTSIAILDFMT